MSDEVVEVQFADRIWVKALGNHYMHVFVYPDQASMLKAANRYQGAGSFGEETLACFSSSLNKDGTPGYYLGMARFSKDALTYELIVHEMIHAAVEQLRRTIGLDNVFAEDGNKKIALPGVTEWDQGVEGEEHLCHDAATLAGAVIPAILGLGHTITL